MPFLTAAGVTKRFGSTVALDGIDLQISRGECLGLVGPNGGGRSTLVRVLATVIRPSTGRIAIDGVDAVRHVFRVRPRLAYVGEEPIAGFGLRTGEYVEFIRAARPSIADRHGVTNAADILKRVGLSSNVSVDSLSSGLRQRLAMATALSIGADALLLDNPLRTVDQSSRAQLVEWLRDTRNRGTTIVVALSDDPDLESICHRVVQLEAGRLVPRAQGHVPAPALSASALSIAAAAAPGV